MKLIIKTFVFCVLFSSTVFAENESPTTNMDHSQHQGMDHSQHEGMDHSQHQGMDHSQHQGMDHSQHQGMDHSQHQGMDHSQHQGMDHSQHQGMDHSQHQGMDHSQHQGMDHSQHEGMDHSQHEGMNEGMNHSQHHGHHGHHDHKMTLDDEGMVMNWNNDELPRDCKSITKEYKFTVNAGTKYSIPFPGTIFGFDQHEWKVEPCSKVTVTFINEDEIRHQWMMHGLPKYIYDQGMFHLEAAGGAQKTGSFIVPSDDKTYLVHCDIAQHMEKGMKGQLIVGKGDGNLPSIPGVTGSWMKENYPTK